MASLEMDWARVQIPQEKVGLELCKRREDGVIDFQVRNFLTVRKVKSQIHCLQNEPLD